MRSASKFSFFLIACACSNACTGEVDLPEAEGEADMMAMVVGDMARPDQSALPDEDLAVMPDMGATPPVDMRVDPSDMNAPPRDQGPPPDMAPVDPCLEVTCGDKAVCRQGTCSCPPGFEGDPSSACTPVSPGDTALRTEAEVCMRWQQDYPPQAASMWQTEPASQCDLGQISSGALDDAARRTNLYRWLVGLDPVTLDSSINQTNQHCATTLAAIGSITHSIPMSAPCYTDQAKQGAGSSNLAQGTRDLAGSIDLYVGDRGVASLGHRRWVFNPRMGKTGFGFRDRISCMHSFDRSNNASPDYVAWPPPGIIPQEAMRGVWSFASGTYLFSSSTQVEVKEVQSGAMANVSNIYVPSGNYGGVPSLAWSVSDVQTDVEYEVTLKDLERGGMTEDVVYRVMLASCN